MTVAVFEAATSLAGLLVAVNSLIDLRAKRLPAWLDVFGLVFGGLFVVNGAIPGEVMQVAAVLSMSWAFGLAAALWSMRGRERVALNTLSTATGD